MGLSSVSKALSSNIPTGLLVDCCCESVQQFFSCSYFAVASVLQCLKLCGYTVVQQNFHREEGTRRNRGRLTPQRSRVDARGTLSRRRRHRGGGCGAML